MRILVVAAGRKGAGPEHELAQDYIARAAASGRNLGFTQVNLIDVQGKPQGDQRAEASAIYKATPDDSRKILLDERGAEWSSREFAKKLEIWRDQGIPNATFWIGGADGASQSLKDQADEKLAFGRQTWPHLLVRAMLAEQIYRAVSILSNAPYHRD
ncbi:MAG: 23S rRNA (pseudouridine(1915)-N(3))-methyltransferase RlmH [Caulobacterales bacterium]